MGYGWEYPGGSPVFDARECREGEAQLPRVRPNTNTQQSMLLRCLAMLTCVQNSRKGTGGQSCKNLFFLSADLCEKLSVYTGPDPDALRQAVSI